MKKILSILIILSVLFLLTACKQDDIGVHLTIVDKEFEDLFFYLEENNQESYENVLIDWQLGFEEDYQMPKLNSLTIYSENISNEDATNIIEIFKSQDIPIFFSFAEIDSEVLDTYDKAYNITLNHTYIGEKFAQNINDLWKEEKIEDVNKDLIFSFQILQKDSISQGQEQAQQSLINNIELLGVPLQELEVQIFNSSEEATNYIYDNKDEPEAVIIFDGQTLEYFIENYETDSQTIKIIGFVYGLNNPYKAIANTKVCFVNYIDFIEVKDKIIENLNKLDYPFSNITQGIKGKTIYVEPII